MSKFPNALAFIILALGIGTMGCEEKKPEPKTEVEKAAAGAKKDVKDAVKQGEADVKEAAKDVKNAAEGAAKDTKNAKKKTK